MHDFMGFLCEKPLLLFATIFLSFLKTALELVEIYLFKDWMYLGFVLILIHLDTILGFWKNAKAHNLSSRGFADYFEKIGLYGAILIMLHVLNAVPIGGQAGYVAFKWFKNAFYFAIMVRESISILENIGSIRIGFVPAWILTYLKKYDASGKLIDLQNHEIHSEQTSARG